MVEYTTQEAKALLTEKLVSAQEVLEQTDVALEYLREQVTTMEVKYV